MVSLSISDKLYLISNLATLLSSGIPILEAIDSLIPETSGNSRKILKTLRQDMNQGQTISQSFSRYPKAFDPITVNLIKAAEEAGTLETILKDLVKTIKKDIDFINKVKSALTYPILVLIILFLVLVINLFFVIPRIAQVFSRLHVPTPLPTKILIATSKLVVDNTLLSIAALIAFLLLILIIVKTQKAIFLGILGIIPPVNKLLTEIDLTRFTRSLALLLKSGIPITDSLKLTQNVVNKRKIEKIIAHASQEVAAGRKLSDGLKDNKIIPNFMIRVTQAGEISGTLEQSMQELSEQFDDRVTQRVKNLTVLLEPLLLLIVGILVGAIMLAIIAPIYNLISNIKSR
ncbi:MAG: Type 4 fimbrial assembly protein pilC [Candidatus Curtissbacteria bacterium GW2011_GWA1_41_11]|uniref:Type 4 fimbrial assembly protein pilC n=1 Tax=Candidatus Curtissbacteria bacterium GW2011_GWA1_41_11 TaxID=1618409 RepID=A0A0G0U833_9BACT|nr:MAG: Type 4 fimbrial assembly protein pilC [Candidatus Curtissbacteria bacterium GW2011_GWA1_41_11]